jgi:DnaJ-class molecular chaperone
MSKPCTWCSRATQVTCPECNGTGIVEEKDE